MAVRGTCECSAPDGTIKGTTRYSKIRLGWPELTGFPFSSRHPGRLRHQTHKLSCKTGLKILMHDKNSLHSWQRTFSVVFFQHMMYSNETGKGSFRTGTPAGSIGCLPKSQNYTLLISLFFQTVGSPTLAAWPVSPVLPGSHTSPATAKRKINIVHLHVIPP